MEDNDPHTHQIDGNKGGTRPQAKPFSTANECGSTHQGLNCAKTLGPTLTWDIHRHVGSCPSVKSVVFLTVYAIAGQLLSWNQSCVPFQPLFLSRILVLHTWQHTLHPYNQASSFHLSRGSFFRAAASYDRAFTSFLCSHNDSASSP